MSESEIKILQRIDSKLTNRMSKIKNNKKKGVLSFADFIKKAAEKQYKKELKNAATKNRK